MYLNQRARQVSFREDIEIEVTMKELSSGFLRVVVVGGGEPTVA